MNVFILICVCSLLLDQGVSDAVSDRVKKLVKKGDSVTLHTGIKINQQDRMTWYFNNVRIAYNNGVPKTCTDDECKERFRDRLELDHQTGSLTITDTRTTDSGEYELLISGSSSEKIFNVTVTDSNADKYEKQPQKEQQNIDGRSDSDVIDSGPSSVIVAGSVVVAVLLLAAAVVGVMIFRRRSSRNNMKKNKQVPELESKDKTRSERKLII